MKVISNSIVGILKQGTGSLHSNSNLNGDAYGCYNSITGCVFFFLLKACDTHMMPNSYKFYNGKAITIFDL